MIFNNGQGSFLVCAFCAFRGGCFCLSSVSSVVQIIYATMRFRKLRKAHSTATIADITR
jgi:hypothetical protein